MRNFYDPSRREHRTPCERTACANIPTHAAGLHLDQRSEHYDGPDSALRVAPLDIRDSARKIVREAPALMPEVMDMVHHIDWLRGQLAAVRVDADRKVREAMARSKDCAVHGGEITELARMLTHRDKAERRAEAGRLALLAFLLAVGDALRVGFREDATVAEVTAAFAGAAEKAHAAHSRAWRG